MVPVSLYNTEGCGQADYTGSAIYARAFRPYTAPSTSWVAANSISPEAAAPAWAGAPLAAKAILLGTQADPVPIIIRQQRPPIIDSAAPLWPLLPSRPSLSGGARPALRDSSKLRFAPNELPPGGLGNMLAAAGAGHQPEPECQLPTRSPSPEPALALHPAPVSPAPITHPPATAQPASVDAAPDGAAHGDSKRGTCDGSAAATAAAATAEHLAAAPCAAAIKPEPQSDPVGLAACAALLVPASTEGHRPVRSKAPRAVAIKAEPRGVAKPASQAAASKARTGGKAAAARLSAVKEECKMEVEDVAPAEAAAMSRSSRLPSAPSPRQPRRRRRGGGRRKPTGNNPGRPRGGASPYANLTQDDMFAYVVDEGGDVLGCTKQKFAAKWGVNTSGFMTKCQTFVRETVKPHLTDLKLILKETSPASRAGSILLDRARIKHEGLTSWQAFAARYLRLPVHPG